MQTLPSEESRRILDAMGIPVVVLREASHEATAASETTTAESGPGQGVSELVAVLEKKDSLFPISNFSSILIKLNISCPSS